jgi:hypothetical protein
VDRRTRSSGHAPPFLAGFLIVLAVLTIGRAILSAGLSFTWFVIIAGLALFGLVSAVLWRRRVMQAKLCYTSGRYYCP